MIMKKSKNILKKKINNNKKRMIGINHSFFIFAYNELGDVMLNKLVWTIATPLILISGIYFTIQLKGVQFNLKKMIKSLKTKEQTTISPIQTLMLSSAAKIGVGSIAGIALALYIGGEGTIFWLWITSFIIAPNAFIESLLGAKYKEKEGDIYTGGPSYYIKKGLNNKKLSILYALLIIVVYIFCFSSIQTNTIASSIYHSYHINKYMIAIFITVISGIVIFKNIKDLIKIISSFVPIMCIIYIFIGLIILIHNKEQLPMIFHCIIEAAFNFKSFVSGFLTSLIIGIQRGIFSNEAGIGTGAIAAATSDTKNYKNQGYIQILGVYFTSLIICSISAFMILLSPYKTLHFENVNGIEISLYAFKYHLGSFGEFFLILSILLFAFSTIIAGYYYGESSLRFIDKKLSKATLLLFKGITLLVLFVGAIIKPSVLWNMSDCIIGLLAIINIYSILKLYKKKKI